jgi:hypothetical protein
VQSLIDHIKTAIDVDPWAKEMVEELLKERKFFADESGKITPLPVVFPNCPLKEYEAAVRCKDCKYGKIHGINVECIAHEEVRYDPEPWHPLDWFCADGERRYDND